MAELVINRSRHQDLLEQFRQYLDRVNQYKIIDRPGIGDDEPHGLSESEPFQVSPLAREVVEAVRLEHIMGLEEAIEGVAGTKAKDAAQLWLGKLTAPVFFERERFERPAREVAAGSLKAFCHIVWNLNCYLHAVTLAGRTSCRQGDAMA
jgi:hypothetical protein